MNLKRNKDSLKGGDDGFEGWIFLTHWSLAFVSRLLIPNHFIEISNFQLSNFNILFKLCFC